MSNIKNCPITTFIKGVWCFWLNVQNFLMVTTFNQLNLKYRSFLKGQMTDFLIVVMMSLMLVSMTTLKMTLQTTKSVMMKITWVLTLTSRMQLGKLIFLMTKMKTLLVLIQHLRTTTISKTPFLLLTILVLWIASMRLFLCLRHPNL